MKRILLCDDDPAVAAIIGRILTHAGYGIQTVGTANDAVKALEGPTTPDLLITDLLLPTIMSGFELANFATALSPPVPVIVLTGYNPDTQAFTDETLKNVVLLKKPVARLTLLDAINAHIQKTQ